MQKLTFSVENVAWVEVRSVANRRVISICHFYIPRRGSQADDDIVMPWLIGPPKRRA